VTIPAASDKQAHVAEPKSHPIVGASPASSLADLRLLIVEDERRTREVLTIALEQFGAKTLAVASAPAGRDALRVFRPDVVLCDIAMPDEDGYTFVSRLRKAERRSRTHIPVLALTALSSSKDRRRVRDSGFDLHLPKPVKTEDLLAAILSLVNRSNDRERDALLVPAETDASNHSENGGIPTDTAANRLLSPTPPTAPHSRRRRRGELKDADRRTEVNYHDRAASWP
jgi:DNA-binding response OmpR family regulator